MEYKRGSEVSVELIHETFLQGFADYGVAFDLSMEDFTRRFIRADGNAPEHTFIAIKDDIGIGLVLGGIRPLDELKTLRCGGLCVVPEHRGTGVASELMKLHLQEGIAQDCKQMMLEVIIDNDRAINFYKKLGYQKKYDWNMFSKEDIASEEASDIGDTSSADKCVEITLDELRKFRSENIHYHLCWGNEIKTAEDTKASNYGIIENGDLVAAVSISGPRLIFLYVKKEHRRTGLATTLINKVKQGDIEKIITFFTHDQALVSFFNKMEFTQENIVQHEMYLSLEQALALPL